MCQITSVDLILIRCQQVKGRYKKLHIHKPQKYTSSKKSHLSGVVIDLWYLEWQKQEKHFEPFPIHQWIN